MNLFAHMSDVLLAALGRPSYFNGATEPVNINIENGVSLAGMGSEQATYRGDYVAQRDVATVPSVLQPKAGDTFVQDGVTYTLETLVKDNGSGVNKRFVIQKVRTP